MRDDLSGLFTDLIFYYNEKFSFLKKIDTNETQLRYFLKSDNINDLYDTFQADNDLFVSLDALEFDIQNTIDKICKICGIDKNIFKKYFSGRNEIFFSKLFSLIYDVESLMLRIVEDRDKLTADMESKLKSVKKDIDTINILGRLKKLSDTCLPD